MRIRALGAAVAALVVWLLASGVSVASADSCPNAVFRTGPSAALPDCRAYEMVSPPFKFGGVPASTIDALDGSNLILSSLGGFGGTADNSGAEGANYSVARTVSGWVSTPIDPPLSQFEGGVSRISQSEVLDVSRDFGRSLFGRVPKAASPVDPRLYVREPGGSLVEVGPAVPPGAVATWAPSSNEKPHIEYLGASADLSHVFFSDQPVGTGHFPWPGDGSLSGESLYEYVGTGNSAPRLVGVDDDGVRSVSVGNRSGDSACQHLATLQLGLLEWGDGALQRRSGRLSWRREGAEVFGSGPAVAEVYARIGGSSTVAISEPSVGTARRATPRRRDRAPAIFQGASQDGSKAFFLTSQPLLDGDSTENLYLYDFKAPAGEKVLRLSAGDPAGANVQGVVGISEDGSRVYFVAQGVLTSTPNGAGQSAVEGDDNLYLYQPDPARPGQFETTFVGVLAGNDEADWQLNDFRPVEVTPDGRFLLFRSTRRTHPGLRRLHEPAAIPIRRTDGCARASHDRGERLQSEWRSAQVSGHKGAAAHAGLRRAAAGLDFRRWRVRVLRKPDGVDAAGDRTSVLSSEEEGECVEYMTNVYEYHEGHVYLISDGQDRDRFSAREDVELIGASPSGGDVLFTTSDPLVAQDTDTQVDVYDARIGGGFPVPPIPASCQGEGCQGGLSTSPSGQIPGSLAFSGPGNPAASRAAVKKGAKKPKEEAA